jgi:hypothetical protein
MRRNRISSQVMALLLLTVFPLMSLLVVEQGRVIDSQRGLIRILNHDSQALNAIRLHEVQNRARQDASRSKNSADGQQPPATPAPEHKKSKRQESPKPPAPQEYPALRQVPARKAV